MKTISAKQLRDDLDGIVKRVRSGESLRVTYRSKPAFVLQPDTENNDKPMPGSVAAMKMFAAKTREINQVVRKSGLDSEQSIKQLYSQMLDSDAKYRGPSG